MMSTDDQELPSTRASFGGNGLPVEFPYGHSTSLCRMVSDETHPRYGNGLLIYQCFPVTVQDHEAGIRLALSLNEKELTEQPFGYGFGSYSYKEGLIAFSCFLPNSIYRPKLLPNLYYACANRAAIIDALLTTSKQTGSH